MNCRTLLLTVLMAVQSGEPPRFPFCHCFLCAFSIEALMMMNSTLSLTWRRLTVPQAQNVWRMLQGKPRDEEQPRAEAERRAMQDAQIDAEWAGVGAATADWDGRPERPPPPRTDKYDLKPYEPEDNDEYRTEEEVAAEEGGKAKGGAVRPHMLLCCFV
jgi:hypothetical protein